MYYITYTRKLHEYGRQPKNGHDYATAISLENELSVSQQDTASHLVLSSALAPVSAVSHPVLLR